MATSTTALDLDGLFGGLFTQQKAIDNAVAEPVPVSPTSVVSGSGLFSSPAAIVPPVAIAQPVPVSPTSAGTTSSQASEGLFSTPAPIAIAQPVPVTPTVADLMSNETASTADTALDSLSFNPFAGMNISNASSYANDPMLGATTGGTYYQPTNPLAGTGAGDIMTITPTDMERGYALSSAQGDFVTSNDLPVHTPPAYYTEDSIKELNSYLGTDEFSTAVSEFDAYTQEAMGDSWIAGNGGSVQLANTMGMPSTIEVPGELGGHDTYSLNAATNQYEIMHEGQVEVNWVKTIAEGVAIVAATAITGGAVGAYLTTTTAFAGVGAATTNAVGTAIANAASTTIQGGDLGDAALAATTAGFGAYADGLNEAAQVAGASSEVIAQAEFINNVSQTINIAEAVHDGDVLSVIGGVVNLTTNASLSDTVSDYYANTFPDVAFVTNNAEALSEASIKLADKLIKGENLEDSLQSAIFEYVREDGTLSGLFDEGTMATPEWIKEFGDYITEGANAIYDNVIDPVVQAATAIGGGALQATEEILSEINREVVQPAIEAGGEVLSDLNESIVQPVLETAEEAIEPVYNFIKEQGGDLLETIGDGAEQVAQFLVDTGEPVVDYLAENGKEFAAFLQEAGSGAVDWLQEKGGVIKDWLKETGSSLADLLSQGWEAVKDLFGDIDLPDIDLPDFNLPSFDSPDISLPDADLSGFSLPSFNFSSGSSGLLSEGDLAKRRKASEFNIQSVEDFTSLENELLT